MENKRKNVYITIFVITTVIAGVVALYLGLENTKLKNANNTKEVKQEEKAATNGNEITKGETVIKEVVKEAELSQENIDKIAQATIENYLNLKAAIFADPLSALVKLGFYSDYTELTNNLKNENGVEISTVKYDDFVGKITKYMTKDLFEESYVKTDVYRNANGYLAKNVGGASGYLVHVSDIKLQNKNNNEFKYEVNYKTFSGFETTITKDEKKIVTIKKVDSDYVVSEVV